MCVWGGGVQWLQLTGSYPQLPSAPGRTGTLWLAWLLIRFAQSHLCGEFIWCLHYIFEKGGSEDWGGEKMTMVENSDWSLSAYHWVCLHQHNTSTQSTLSPLTDECSSWISRCWKIAVPQTRDSIFTGTWNFSTASSYYHFPMYVWLGVRPGFRICPIGIYKENK